MTFNERPGRTPSTAPDAVATRHTPRWLIPFVSVIALLAVVATVIAVVITRLPHPASQTSGASTATPKAAPLALDPAAYGLACVEGAAWSPDSAEVAILGTQKGCAGSTSTPDAYYPTAMAIVNAGNGKLLASLQLDATVLGRFHLQAPQAGARIAGPDASGVPGELIQPGIMYDGPVWSPDGKSVAAPFSFAYMGASSAGGSPGTRRITVSGFYIGSSEGDAGGAGESAFGVSLDQQTPYVAEWNVKTGKPVLKPTWLGPAIHNGTVAQLEPASLSYSWRPDGSLTGSGALTTTQPAVSASPGPVGNPDGGASFSVWQGMSVQVNVGDPQNPQPATFMADAYFLAWSPDGTYLLNASYNWRVQPSKQQAPTPDQLQREGATGMPLLPIRDAAMDAALSPEQGDHPYTFASDTFTWSPDGKLLAAIADGGVHTVSADVTVLIADCASGKTLATLQVGNTSTAYGNLASVQWSPDGKKLLVGADSEYLVIGPGMLPQA